MKKLKELDLYEQSIQKLNFCLYHIENLKKKEELDLNDQIMINLLLNVYKSVMEYSIQRIKKHNNVSKNKKPYIPNKKEMKSIETFYNLLNERFGVNDNRGREIFDSLFYTETYNEFNKMQNNEKHSMINVQFKNITKGIGYTEQKGVIIKDVSISGHEDNVDTLIMPNSRKIDFSKVKDYSYKEEIYFEYNNREVFEFLDDVYQMVNNFVIDIREYIDKRDL
ncbi:hypothetical protein K1Y28_04955 [Staphylococcus warneri]|nr:MULTISPECIES: hypothetical protein [Staphylococcus]MBE9428814.1 hypothetical protein [Staphylococcus epidermidis]AXV42940.1 hypothetical protein Ssp1_19280 [Staphylococcus sp. M0911]MCD8803994.1 hypothetical protein [Staphylococcus warneri]MCD8805592.1 hypothetical protein [Staphylococcus warneri]OLS04616.1 hypothetical protein AUK68_11105 [Staphylococcus epidermidis]